jgi:2-polyprenyl-6-methoxyphenol hydroxylase-like FAD-dependent oxidoreductase
MIIGAGIGGLCLAQGLRQAGAAVTVYERTEARTDWLQGYRIHINPNGSRALHACLPPAAWHAFLETVSVDGGGFGFTTERLDDLLRFSADEITPAGGPEDRHYGVSRISLREVLLSGMDDVIRLGREFTHYETTADGRVTAHFADGSTATAELLIGADGANSRERSDQRQGRSWLCRWSDATWTNEHVPAGSRPASADCSGLPLAVRGRFNRPRRS